MVMPANNSSAVVHYWAGRYPGSIGWLVGPSAMSKTKLREWMPFALDNDAFSAWSKGRVWDKLAWISMLNTIRISNLVPKWILVPDVVTDRDATLRKWEEHHAEASQYGWPLAMAVQDGMTPADLPDDCLVFVGGSTEWKWESLPMWCSTGRHIHVGRVNSFEKLVLCSKLGVESVDGTGWMRGTDGGRQAQDLKRWIEECGSSHTNVGTNLWD